MRIGSEAPKERAHSKSRLEDHVQGRVATTSGRRLQLGINSRPNCRNSVVCLFAGKSSHCRPKEKACRRFASSHQSPRRNKEPEGERADQVRVIRPGLNDVWL